MKSFLVFVVLSAGLLVNTSAFATTGLQICGAADADIAAEKMQREADMLCGHKEKLAVAASQVFVDTRKKVVVINAYGQLIPATEPCYKQEFNCVKPQ